ncbi:MAG TPA: hypothetical protein VMS88_09150, partial [Terriglobales bacterium]|nr:hypothetical protein [Terriglobales bacterium]
MERAAAALALRGHCVGWWGTPPPDAPGVLQVHGVRDLLRTRADVVLGGGDPVRVGLAGWLSSARCMVLSLDRAAVARWGWLARGAWTSLHSWALVDEAEGEALRRDPLGLDRARIGLWPSGDPARAP